VSSLALIELAQERGALYLDTCIEPWPGGYTDPSKPQADRTTMRCARPAMALKPNIRRADSDSDARRQPRDGVAFRQAGAARHRRRYGYRNGAAGRSRRLGQAGADAGRQGDPYRRARHAKSSQRKKQGEFVNTWSIDGFVGEGANRQSLAGGATRVRCRPDGNRQETGSRAAIFLSRPGASTRVRTWTPKAGPFHGFLITHSEAISIAAHLSVGEGDHPEIARRSIILSPVRRRGCCRETRLAGRNWKQQPDSGC